MRPEHGPACPGCQILAGLVARKQLEEARRAWVRFRDAARDDRDASSRVVQTEFDRLDSLLGDPNQG